MDDKINYNLGRYSKLHKSPYDSNQKRKIRLKRIKGIVIGIVGGTLTLYSLAYILNKQESNSLIVNEGMHTVKLNMAEKKSYKTNFMNGLNII